MPEPADLDDPRVTFALGWMVFFLCVVVACICVAIVMPNTEVRPLIVVVLGATGALLTLPVMW